MLTTEETKRIAKIMFDGGPKKMERIGNVVRQLQMMPDTIRVDFQAVITYLIEVLENENNGLGKNCRSGRGPYKT